MDFCAVLNQVLELLRHSGRVSYRALKLRVHLDDEQLEAPRDELLYAQRPVVDEAGPGLVRTSERVTPAAVDPPAL